MHILTNSLGKLSYGLNSKVYWIILPWVAASLGESKYNIWRKKKTKKREKEISI